MNIDIPTHVIYVVDDKYYCLRCAFKLKGQIKSILGCEEDYATCSACEIYLT